MLEDGLTSLTREVAELREEVSEFREEFTEFREQTGAHFAQLNKLIVDGQATIVSAVMTLSKK